ncbi:protein BTG3-like [Pseudophryne corroboree]|uniref:protein BTG3-like n=1 Tax=Pseudophryne corroboree TaxID=495146 RepID=UPI0030812C49
MVAFAFIPVEMREELVAGVEYIKTLMNRWHKLDPVMVGLFGEKLAEILCRKYTGHWYPEKPMNGQAYRCIRMNRYDRDESILVACSQSGLKYQELTLPKEITVWIDPYEVSCRLGEEGYPYTVAKFDQSEDRVPAASKPLEEQEQVSSSSKCSTPTPDEDSSTWSSSIPSSPSITGEDSDSGIDASSEDAIATLFPYRPIEDNVWWHPSVEPVTPASPPLFRTSSALWIPAWRTTQFYDISRDLQQTIWL